MQSLLFQEDIRQESKDLLSAVPHSERGAIYTKTEVVNFMLDLSFGNREKGERIKVLEPSFGRGNFLTPIVERLVTETNGNIELLSDSIRGYELSGEDFTKTKEDIKRLLLSKGIALKDANLLVNQWLIHDDFLLSEPDRDFTHAVGNPPYLRIERIPPTILAAYRSKFTTLHDRGDIYIAFFEQCLWSLAGEGSLTFICTDRWMKSKYGEKLRGLVTDLYSLDYYLDLCGTQPFETEVTTYPAIFKISNAPGKTTCYAGKKIKEIEEIHNYLPSKDIAAPQNDFIREIRLKSSRGPIILNQDKSVELLRKIESEQAPITDYCDISIGIATGADKIFIGKFEDSAFEEGVLVPILKAKDINLGTVDWSGHFLINPYETTGDLRELAQYPKLNAYLQSHKNILSGRHCARKQPNKWYKTIDKYHHDLPQRQKLLVPDIRSNPKVVHEDGKYYPHHNLYYMTSECVDLMVLSAILNCGIMNLFIRTYSTPMQGGCYRFQAQHLRKIRIPKSIARINPTSKILGPELIESLYGLGSVEMDLLASFS
jgi:hypothetical protein